jgi:site-specific recombinase XerD
MALKRDDSPIESHLINFLEYLAIEKGLSNKTQENYRRFLKKFFDWLKENGLEKIKPHELTEEHIWKYRVWLSRQPLKKSTQNYYLIALRSLLNYFTERNILSLPSEKVKLARDKSEKRIKFLTLDQLKRLLEAPSLKTLTGLRDRAILETLFSTGLRVSEIVNLNRDQIKIKPETKDLEISIVGKGDRIRTVYLSERAVDALRKYLQTRNDKEKALFINYRGPKNSPRRLTPRAIQKIVKKYSLMAGLPIDITPHVLRHTFATDLLNQGVDIRVVQEFLGHKNITTTQVYTHVTNPRLREIHRKFHSGRKLK